jgi:hypothetical protein
MLSIPRESGTQLAPLPMALVRQCHGRAGPRLRGHLPSSPSKRSPQYAASAIRPIRTRRHPSRDRRTRVCSLPHASAEAQQELCSGRPKEVSAPRQRGGPTPNTQRPTVTCPRRRTIAPPSLSRFHRNQIGSRIALLLGEQDEHYGTDLPTWPAHAQYPLPSALLPPAPARRGAPDARLLLRYVRLALD